MLAIIIKNIFTNTDDSISFAKVMGAIGFIMLIFMVTVGVPLWTLIAIQAGIKGIPSLEQWGSYYTGGSILVAATYAGLTGLVWGETKSKNTSE